MEDQQFNLLTRHLDNIEKSQEHQLDSTTRIFERLEAHGNDLVEVKTKIELFNGIKEDVKEHSRKLAILRGVGLAVTGLISTAIAWMKLNGD